MEQRLIQLLKKMGVPNNRIGTGVHSLIWLHRNLGKVHKYLSHPNFQEAKKIIRTLLRGKTSG